MAFDQGKETVFGDIRDGTSNTLLIATVAAKHAVIWTKPADWQLDLDDPTKELRAQGRKFATCALMDGSANQFKLDAPKVQWQRIVQPDDGDVVDTRKLTK